MSLARSRPSLQSYEEVEFRRVEPEAKPKRSNTREGVGKTWNWEGKASREPEVREQSSEMGRKTENGAED